jgi:FixJ family two-component response regulator
MPDLDGEQLGIQAKVMRPNLHIIYISGFAEAAEKARNGRVIQKPIRAAKLLKIVAQGMSAEYAPHATAWPQSPTARQAA